MSKNVKLCKNCRWWKPLPADGCTGGNYCDFSDTIEAAEKTSCEIVWEALDDSGLDIWLKTAPDYGCPNFEGVPT